MKNDRFWWVGGFLAGLLVGLGLSLVYTWVLDPPPLTMTTPAALNPHDREVYTVLVAAAYAADRNLDQAEKRLADDVGLGRHRHVVLRGQRKTGRPAEVRTALHQNQLGRVREAEVVVTENWRQKSIEPVLAA